MAVSLRKLLLKNLIDVCLVFEQNARRALSKSFLFVEAVSGRQVFKRMWCFLVCVGVCACVCVCVGVFSSSVV